LIIDKDDIVFLANSASFSVQSKCSNNEEIIVTAPSDLMCLQDNKFITDSFLDYYIGEIFSKLSKKEEYFFPPPRLDQISPAVPAVES
jgi:Ulp1 family protease